MEADTAEQFDAAALRELAEAAALRGAAVSKAGFRAELDVQFKADHSEVTEYDIRAEQAIIETVIAARPDDRFLGEEVVGGADYADRVRKPDGAGVTWVIDPIDGTRNFIRRIPQFACSVAAVIGGAPVAGVIIEPINENVYSSHAGAGGVWLNGIFKPRADLGPNVGEASRDRLLLATPSSRLRGDANDPVPDWYDGERIRNLGTTALHLALIAAGKLDGGYFNNPKVWDIAAGWLLVEEAGGRMTGPTGEPLFPVDLVDYKPTNIACVAGVRPADHARMLKG